MRDRIELVLMTASLLIVGIAMAPYLYMLAIDTGSAAIVATLDFAHTHRETLINAGIGFAIFLGAGVLKIIYDAVMTRIDGRPR